MTDVLLAVGGLQILNVQLGSWIDEYSLMCVMLVSSIIMLYASQAVCSCLPFGRGGGRRGEGGGRRGRAVEGLYFAKRSDHWLIRLLMFLGLGYFRLVAIRLVHLQRHL